MRSFTRFARLATASIVGVLMLGATAQAATPEAYRPHTTAGTYVPTVMPAVPQ